jgi:peptidoglycan-associated lipoprotein
MRKWIIVAFVMALVAGCKSTEEQPAPVEEGAPTATAPAATPGATTSGATAPAVSGTAGGPYSPAALKDPNSILSKRSIYFDFDDATVKDQYRPIIEAHAKYLQVNKNAHVTLQGNTDERGTREYNIALGQKRADAVKKMMVLYGAQEIQIETVSFGKEKPRREGHDETSWAENRRVDIVHAGE